MKVEKQGWRRKVFRTPFYFDVLVGATLIGHSPVNHQLKNKMNLVRRRGNSYIVFEGTGEKFLSWLHYFVQKERNKFPRILI